MNIKVNIIGLFVYLMFPATAQENPAHLPRPKLMVGVVVDQMRWDYLYRYYDRYTEDGFKRMLHEGFSCENASIDYIPTLTAIGHATVYTGSVPAIHGIAGNDFIIQSSGKKIYCTEDSTVQTVGSSSLAGKMSPRNLLSSTITDELRLATNFGAKVIGIALKDRGGILAAGHAANAAYWFDDATGNWITSTWYMNDLPGWVKKLNRKKLPEKYLKQDWNTLYPIATYTQSTADNVPYEGAFDGANSPVFPIETGKIFEKNGAGIIRSTPFGNTLTLDMAKAAIENEQLGEDAVTDFLAVSFSSTDYIGHRFGTNSVEIEDTYLRLDQELSEFFLYLDNKIGKGNYTLFLTSDHGAAHNSRFLTDHKMAAGYWAGKPLLEQLNQLLEAEFGINNLAISFANYQIHLNNPLIKGKQLDEAAVRRTCLLFMEKQEGVAFVVDMKGNAHSPVPAMLQSRINNGYNPQRSGAIQIILKPAWYSGTPGGTGTTHGTWSPYDAHIPLLWMGWGIKKGRSYKPVNMTDIAATLGALLHIQSPNGSVGTPIAEIFQN